MNTPCAHTSKRYAVLPQTVLLVVNQGVRCHGFIMLILILKEETLTRFDSIVVRSFILLYIVIFCFSFTFEPAHFIVYGAYGVSSNDVVIHLWRLLPLLRSQAHCHYTVCGTHCVIAFYAHVFEGIKKKWIISPFF